MNIKRICEQHLKDRYDLEVIDIYQQPMRPSVTITDLAACSLRKTRTFSPTAGLVRTSVSSEN